MNFIDNSILYNETRCVKWTKQAFQIIMQHFTEWILELILKVNKKVKAN